MPKDTKALIKLGEKHGVDMSLVREVVSANEAQKLRVVEKLERELGNLNGKKIAILGVAFKAGTDDIRESPAIVIIDELIKRGAVINVHDPKALENAKRIWRKNVNYFSNQYDAVKGTDALVILTEWNEYRNLDLEVLSMSLKGNLVIDARNVLDPLKVKQFKLDYIGTGRR